METGYDPFFLSESHDIPLPQLTGKTAKNALENGRVFDFTHFCVVMNKRTRFAVYSAACVDKSRLRDVRRDNTSWHFDERIGSENQVGPEYYAENDFDRGHLTRRRDICWGERQEAEQANYDSFCFANICLQHHHFNTGIWNCLEDWVLERMENTQKLIVLTGPIHKEDDEEYCGVHGTPGCGVHIPFGFWKSVFFLNARQQVTCLSFLIRQSRERLRDQCEYQRLVTYQVPLATITNETELQFKTSLYETNPLESRAIRQTSASGLAAPKGIAIRQASDIVWESGGPY